MDTQVSEEERREAYKTLAYVQRTCRSFELAARKKIWEEQYGFNAIMHLITKWVSTTISCNTGH